MTESEVKETPAIDAILAPVICIIVGHEKHAGGAELNHPAYPNEYAYNSQVAKLIKSRAGAIIPRALVYVIFRDGIGISGAYHKAAGLKPDACIELHFNAANRHAIGSETLCSVEQKDRELAGFVQTEICRVFERHGVSRGVKVLPRSARGGGNIYGLPGYANCLVEPFFGDNLLEAALAVKKIEEYADGLLIAIDHWCKKVGLS